MTLRPIIASRAATWMLPCGKIKYPVRRYLMGSGRLVGLLLLLTAIGGCRHSTCQELAERPDRISETIAACHGMSPAVVSLAARPHETPGRDDDVLRLTSQLVAAQDGIKIAGDLRQMMARVYLKRKRFCLARLFYENALALHRAKGDHVGAYADAQELADALRDRYDFEDALKLAKTSLDEATRAGDSVLESRALRLLARVHHDIGNNAEARETYRAALAKLGSEDRKDRALELIHRGAFLAGQHQYALARQDLEDALALATQLQDFKLARDAEVNLSNIDMGQENLDAAWTHLDRAQAAWDKSGQTRPSAGILVNRAILSQMRRDFPRALRALDELSSADPPPDAETAWLIAQQRGSIYMDAGADRMAEEAFHQATSIVEEMWSTSPLASFLEERWSPYQSLFALQIKRNALQDAFETVIRAQGRMFLARAIGAKTSSAKPECQEHLRSPREMVDSSPLAQALSATETLDALGGRYVLNYFVGAERMRLLVIDGGRVSLASVDVAINDLDRLVTAFLMAPDGDAADELGKLLLPPDVSDRAPPRFYVVPAGPLLRIPFAALKVRGQRVVSRHEIVYAPSATGLARLATAAARPASAPVLLHDARSNLLHGGEEANVVVSLVNAIQKTGSDANIAALRAAANAELLHVIGHSGLDHDGGYLVLADGHVTAADIVGWGVRPRLVVLPTCASAATSKQDMWGSLAVAFLAAGSVNVVATLFSVEDVHAVDFTKAFYKHHGAHDPVGATAEAQREMIAGNHPTSVWSAFIVVGL